MSVHGLFGKESLSIYEVTYTIYHKKSKKLGDVIIDDNNVFQIIDKKNRYKYLNVTNCCHIHCSKTFDNQSKIFITTDDTMSNVGKFRSCDLDFAVTLLNKENY